MGAVKKILFVISLCFLSFITTNISAQASVKINKTDKTMYINDTYTLKVTGTKQYILWKSSDKKVASVTKKGKVTAKKAGTCIITAIIGSGMNNQKLSCRINVNSKLSCDDKIIRCYTDEYNSVRINTKHLSKYESLVIEEDNSKIVSADWDYKSDYFDIIVIPKKLGVTKIKVSVANEKDSVFSPKNDFITFLVVSYPDRTGWLDESNLKYYNLDFTLDFILIYEHIDDSSFDLDGIIDTTELQLNPDIDMQEDQSSYISNGLKYKIINGKQFYFDTKSLEDIFFYSML